MTKAAERMPILDLTVDETDDLAVAGCCGVPTSLGAKEKSERLRRVGVRERQLALALGAHLVKCSSLTTNVVLTVASTTAGTASVIYLPILTASFSKHVSCGRFQPITSTTFVQIYSSLWLAIILCLSVLTGRIFVKDFNWRSNLSYRFRLLIGLFGATNFFMSTYASLPSRTPPGVQPLFYMTMVPLTVITRYIILRKTVSVPRLICAFGVIVGMFIGLEPEIFQFNVAQYTGSEMRESFSQAEKGLWTVMFGLSFIPLSVMNVLFESAFEKDISGRSKPVHPLVLAMWLQCCSTVFMILFCFTDRIPHFGTAQSFGAFTSHISQGFGCMFGVTPSPGNCSAVLTPGTTPLPGALNPDPHCHIPIERFWSFIVIFLADNLLVTLVMKYSDGAIYAALVASLKAPLATIFWRLVKLNKFAHVVWDPRADATTGFVLVGLCFIVPFAGIYNYLTYKEEESVASGLQKSNTCKTENGMVMGDMKLFSPE